MTAAAPKEQQMRKALAAGALKALAAAALKEEQMTKALAAAALEGQMRKAHVVARQSCVDCADDCFVL